MPESNQPTPTSTKPDTKCKKCKHQKMEGKEKASLKKRLQRLPKVFIGVAIGPVLAQILCAGIALTTPLEGNEKWSISLKVSLGSLLLINCILVALMFLLLLIGSRRNSYRMQSSTLLLGQGAVLFLSLFPMMTSREDHFVFSSPLLTLLIVIVVSIPVHTALIIYVAVYFTRYKKKCKCPPEEQPKVEVTTTTLEPSLMANPTKTTKTSTTTTRVEKSPAQLKSKPKKVGMTLPQGMVQQISPTSSAREMKKLSPLELADVQGSLAELNEEEEKEEKEKRKRKKNKRKKRETESEMSEVDQEKSSKAPSEKEVEMPISRMEASMNSKVEQVLPDKIKNSQKTAQRRKKTVSIEKTQ